MTLLAVQAGKVTSSFQSVVSSVPIIGTIARIATDVVSTSRQIASFVENLGGLAHPSRSRKALSRVGCRRLWPRLLASNQRFRPTFLQAILVRLRPRQFLSQAHLVHQPPLLRVPTRRRHPARCKLRLFTRCRWPLRLRIFPARLRRRRRIPPSRCFVRIAGNTDVRESGSADA